MATEDVRWLNAAESPFGVPVIDLRPFALAMLSTSRDPQMAQNAMSYRGDDGSELAAQQPPSSRRVECALRFSIDRVLLDGALFMPAAMEDKWALYVRGGELLCIRSWLRRVFVRAAIRLDGNTAILGPVTGTFLDDESEDMTVRELDFVVRTHALAEVVPAPLAAEPADLHAATLQMFSLWGRRALFATHHALPRSMPQRLLRTDSLLHIAVARGDRGTVEGYLAAGVPFDVLARDGFALTQWALASSDPAMLDWLLDRGCPVDLRSAEGATALMNAVQARKLDRVRMLVARGADIDARDVRGFTSLHRAAEMGELEIVRLLLAEGADPYVEAQGYTPLALAQARNESAIVALLKPPYS